MGIGTRGQSEAGFNPRLPRGRRPDSADRPRAWHPVSIRASRAGGDWTAPRQRQRSRGFNPRLPRGRRRWRRSRENSSSMFQSAPPAREATLPRRSRHERSKFQSAPPAREATAHQRRYHHRMLVSIRASRAGGDETLSRSHGELEKFQSAPPAREATRAERVQMPAWVFQSAPPAREATPPSCSRLVNCDMFQSAPPAREATGQGVDSGGLDGVSIRASRAGGDSRGPEASVGARCFNPRLPRGRRPGSALT